MKKKTGVLHIFQNSSGFWVWQIKTRGRIQALVGGTTYSGTVFDSKEAAWSSARAVLNLNRLEVKLHPLPPDDDPFPSPWPPYVDPPPYDEE